MRLTKRSCRHQRSQLVTEHAEAGQVVVPEGELGKKFFIIVKGKVELSTQGDNGKHERIALLGAGDYFGELLTR